MNKYRIYKDAYLVPVSIINIVSFFIIITGFVVLEGINKATPYIYLSLIIILFIWILNIVFYFNDFNFEIHNANRESKILLKSYLFNNVIFGLSIPYLISMIYFTVVLFNDINIYNFWFKNTAVYIGFILILTAFIVYANKILNIAILTIFLILGVVYIMINCFTFPSLEQSKYFLWFQLIVLILNLFYILRVIFIYHYLSQSR
ncbi:hypothetical protein ACN9U4_01950 [Staphylococcus caprae]|uniref:hypothetical protein n=1 Tax=Staphylococcus caprae TaxID=29380 RepID=UPI000E6973AC|nr:hypothetical protein [Staphylococcus caprae]MDK6296857.1 hypothetical protein [Staphylococcus caprae]MDK7232357.1 hypothetical protein [Staphylococcus caprae]RIM32908.1 hypothetical protein BU631_12230 [Staphylococcus caprae]